MMLPVYNGVQYSYLLEVETGNYLLYDNTFKAEVYLQGDDALLFSQVIDLIDRLPEPQYKTGKLIENTISEYL